jgi:hypothetical protein
MLLGCTLTNIVLLISIYTDSKSYIEQKETKKTNKNNLIQLKSYQIVAEMKPT